MEFGEMAGEVRDGDIPGLRDAGTCRLGVLTERDVSTGGSADGNCGAESVLAMRRGDGAAL